MDILVYVAGPLTEGGRLVLGNVDRTNNMHYAVNVGDWLWTKHGIKCFVPHVSEAWEELHPHPYSDWLDWCLTILERCDILYRMPGKSTGADMEVRHAEKLGIPVYDDLKELIDDWGHNEQADRRAADRGNRRYAQQGGDGNAGGPAGSLWYL